VLTFLVSKGVDPRLFMASGYGDTAPISANDNDEDRAKNRRVEIFIEPAGSK
jgi:flagellar motor protein MotB